MDNLLFLFYYLFWILYMESPVKRPSAWVGLPAKALGHLTGKGV